MNKKNQKPQNNFFDQLSATFFDAHEDGEPQLWKYKGFDDCDSCFWKTGYQELIELIAVVVQGVEQIRSRRY